MSIQALPHSTVRALGATQALTDPASLVKELLDNALDANANSVAISIASNSLDVIQLRDNGHGIAPQDRPLVARRYCTSKICDDGDLKDIGGSSLGFRGEALASAAELSGSLLISTRTESEQVAASLKISQQGEVVSQERASLPVGTTVRVTDFIKANPVRRQVALKNVDACLRKIKRLLQSYAFARPHVRYSLQVLKAKNNKADWVYAPKPNGNAEDAAFKIVGAACASSCLWSVIDEQGLTLQAFLPRPDADVGKISNIGSFVSIDARPVSSSRGLLKQITKVFRDALKSADGKFDGVKDPFIFLEISGGSYDANLEPAKDDVLFDDADAVLQVVKRLFAAVYPPAPPVVTAEEPATFPIQSGLMVEDNDDDNFTTSLEQDLPTAPSTSIDVHKEATEDWLENVTGQQRFQVPSTPAALARAPVARSNMYGCDEEDLDLYDNRPSTGLTEADFAELRQSRNDVTLSNPWVFARMNATTKAPVLEEARRSRSPFQRPHLAGNASRETSPLNYQQRPGVSGLPTPRPSSASPPVEDFRPPDHGTSNRSSMDGRLIGPTDLPLPQACTPASSIAHHNTDLETVDRALAAAPDYPYTLGRNAPERAAGIRLSDIPDVTPRPRRNPMSRVNKPFVPPSRDEPQREQVWFEQPGGASTARPRRARPGYSDRLVAQGELGDLVEGSRPLTPPRRNRDIRDFIGSDASNSVSSMIESRNFGRSHQQAGPSHDEESQILPEESTRPVEAIRQNRGFVPASELIAPEEHTEHVEKQPPRVSKRRKTTDRTPLRELSTNSPGESAEPEDDAEYGPATSKRVPSRRRSSKGINRTKSSRLPLERIPSGQATHDLIFNASTDIEQLHRLVGSIDPDNSLLSYNEPAVDVNDGFGLREPPDLMALTANLHRLLVTAGSDTDVVDSADLLHEVQAAFAQHAAALDSDAPMSTA